MIANDTLSGDGGNLWTKLTDPANGTLVFNSDGSFTYTPNANYHGTDSFTYQLCDLDTDCDPATVTITVESVDDAPVASDDTFTATEDTLFTGSVIANDTLSGDGGNLWTKLTDPANGTLVFNSDGSFTYLPKANYHGTDSFTYQLCDLDTDCDPATVTITVESVDDAPVANDDTFSATEDTLFTGSVIANDTLSGDGGNLWTKLTDPANGTLVFNSDGSFTYTPNANYHGTDSFTYQLCDLDTDCDPATVTITVESVDDAPVANDDTFSATEDTLFTGSVIANDTLSGDGGNLWTKLTDPANGTLVFNSDGSFTYLPNANYHGTDSFTYQLCDLDTDCDPATVTITVESVDDAPVANDDTFTATEDTLFTGSVIANDTLSGDGGNLWTKLTDPANGTLVFNSDGSFTYLPNANYHGTDSFTYQLCDLDTDCDPATVTITVESVDDAPVANDDTFYRYRRHSLHRQCDCQRHPLGRWGQPLEQADRSRQRHPGVQQRRQLHLPAQRQLPRHRFIHLPVV